MSLATDLHVLLTLKPLLDNGFVMFYTPAIHSCLNCYEAILGVDTLRKIDRGYKQLLDDYLNNSSVKLSKYNKRIAKFVYDGPEPYYEHGVVLTNYARDQRFHKILNSKPRIINQLKKHGEVQLSKTVQKQLGLHRWFAGQVAESAAASILSAKLLKSSFLTSNPLDISFLQSISDNPQIDKRNSIAYKHLTSTVPFIADVNLLSLIKIRQREEEAFSTDAL
jgi:hypothetical protein